MLGKNLTLYYVKVLSIVRAARTKQYIPLPAIITKVCQFRYDTALHNKT